MPPHALNSSSRKRPAPSDDDVGEVVHVKLSSASLSGQRKSTTIATRSSAALGATSRIATRNTKHTRGPQIMSATVKEGNPTPRISRAKKGKRVHACNHHGCDKIFTRAEHLRRHQLNHNTDVYFKCDLCDRTFVRHDLLVRHQERHATQAIKAVQTLAMAQRHGNLPDHYAINRLQGLAGQPQHATEYSRDPHLFDSSHHQQNVDVIPQNVQVTSSPHSTSSDIAQVSMPNMGPGYATSMHVGHGSDGYASTDSTPSPSGSIGRGQLPYQLQPGEMQRQQESYLSHTDMIHRSSSAEDQSSLYAMLAAWDNNINWLFDDTAEKPRMDEIHTVNYIHPLEMAYNRSIAHPLPDISSIPPPPGVRGNTIIFHPMDDNMRNEILLLVGGGPNLQNSSFASLSSMQRYLRIYWNNFHVLYPVLHRPSFVPGLSMVCLAAIVIAIGASYTDGEAHEFAMAIYDKVKALLINSNDYATAGTPNNLPILQTLMLTDIFGKLRSTRDQFDGVQLDMILAGVCSLTLVILDVVLLNCSDPAARGAPADALERLRVLQRDGLDYHLESEWHHWILLEGRKRVATLFFWFDVQQAVIFGREACQTAFDLQAGLPSGKEEVLWDADCASDWLNSVDTQADQPTFLGVLRIFFDQKKQIPHISPLASLFILHGLISVSLDLKRSKQRNTVAGIEKQARLLQAYEKWRQHYEKTVAIHLRSPCHNKIMVMYHMAFVTMHTNLHLLYTVAGDTRLFSRSTERIDYYHAKNELDQWANSPTGQLATWHAIQIIVRMRSEAALVREQLHMPWMQYIALLMCWVYGSLSKSPLAGQPDDGSTDYFWDASVAQQDIQAYLQQMNTRTWQELAHARNFRGTAGLIAVVKQSWDALGLRWGLLDQAAEVLRNVVSSRNLKSA
ncbi:fungal-specific transcription factor domain-containing protein [Kalaharituber pfeilii]|nr:fungal-specific transcription factor domain-containing protein [Kalaharituber pfeilii]